MLILSDTDALGINFHKFGQRVKQSASDRYGTTHSNILVGKFLTGHFGCRIYRGSMLVDHKYLYPSREYDIAKESFSLTATGAGADCNRVNAIVVDHVTQRVTGSNEIIGRRSGVDHIMIQQIALLIKSHDLATCAVAGVNSQDSFAAERRGHKKLTNIVSKHLYGSGVAFFFCHTCDFIFNRRAHQPTITVLDGCLYYLGQRYGCCWADKHAVKTIHHVIILYGYAYAKNSFLLCPAYGKVTVRVTHA